MQVHGHVRKIHSLWPTLILLLVIVLHLVIVEHSGMIVGLLHGHWHLSLNCALHVCLLLRALVSLVNRLGDFVLHVIGH